MAKSYISPKLPEEFRKKQEWYLFFDDILSNLLIKADEEDIVSVKIDLSEIDIVELEHTDDVIQCLIDHGKEQEAVYIQKVHAFFSILADYKFYTHEAISCAERGKVSVAYTLSRKPFQNNLFFFVGCWSTLKNALIILLKKILGNMIQLAEITNNLEKIYFQKHMKKSLGKKKPLEMKILSQSMI